MKAIIPIAATSAMFLSSCLTMEEKTNPDEGVFEIKNNIYKAVGKSSWTPDMAASGAAALAASYCEDIGKEYLPRNSRASWGTMQDTAVIVFSCFDYDDHSEDAQRARMIAAENSKMSLAGRQVVAQERQAQAAKTAASAELMRTISPQKVQIQHQGTVNHHISVW